MSEEKKIHIIGAGLGGLSAALTLAKKGIPCNLISAQPSERAQSVLAEGGINAALDTMGENDSPAEHMADSLKGGCFLQSEEELKGLTESAPDIVRELCRLGVPFHAKDGKLILRNFGGQKKKRTAFAKSSTGKIVTTALIDEVRKYEAAGLVARMPRHELCGIDTENGSLKSVTVWDRYRDRCFRLTGTVILCTGGLSGFFPGCTTGTTQNTGNAAALAFGAGVEMANLEFLQYHPTTVGITGKCMLVSEAARGEGGRLCILRNGEPWYFMEERYPELKNLMPRDVVAREMTLVRSEPGVTGSVMLDLTGIPEEVWDRRLSDLREELMSYLPIDPKVTPVPVTPGIHYFMGGIRVGNSHETNIRGLYAAGEAACKYHGANRLGANSMLGAIYGGRVAAENAAKTIRESGICEVPDRPGKSSPVLTEKLKECLMSGLGILREESMITAALELTDRLMGEAESELDRKRIRLGQAMLLSALMRKESRGAHTRTDYPGTRDEYRKLTVAKDEGDRIGITFRSAEESPLG